MRRWIAATSHTEAGTSLALYRMGIAFGALLWIGSLLPSGVWLPLWVDRTHGGMEALQPGLLLSALGGATPGAIQGLIAVGLGLGVAMMLGLGGRLTAFCLLQVTMALDVNRLAGGSYDQLLANGLWLAVLAPTTTTLSLDSRLRTGSWRNAALVGMWGRYLIAFQLVVVYASTGWQKLSAYWTPGGDFSALYYILQQPSWQRSDMAWIAPLFPLTQLATAVTWLWEVTAPMMLLALWWHETREQPGRLRAWSNRLHLRAVYVSVGIVLHVSILLVMNVGPFTPITLAFYAAFLTPAEWDRLLFRGFAKRRPAGA